MRNSEVREVREATQEEANVLLRDGWSLIRVDTVHDLVAARPGEPVSAVKRIVYVLVKGR